MRDWELTFLSVRFHLEHVNSTLFLFHANSSKSGILSSSESQEQLRLSGFGVKSLKPGYVFLMAESPFFHSISQGWGAAGGYIVFRELYVLC